MGDLELSAVNWKLKERITIKTFLSPAIQKEEKSRTIWALLYNRVIAT